jgi:hypothetical protein
VAPVIDLDAFVAATNRRLALSHLRERVGPLSPDARRLVMARLAGRVHPTPTTTTSTSTSHTLGPECPSCVAGHHKRGCLCSTCRSRKRVDWSTWQVIP